VLSYAQAYALPVILYAQTIALASKILSLELLLSILDNPGPTFCNSEVFAELVRDSLVMALLQNCVTTIEPVFRLSSSIFVTLIAHFKPHLKTEIGKSTFAWTCVT